MLRGVLKHSNCNRKLSPFRIKKEIEGWEVRLNNWRIKLKNGDVPVFSLGKPTLLFGSTSSRGWKCPILGAGTSRVSHRWSLIKQFSHCHTRTEAEAGRESGPQRPHVAAACPRLSTGYSTSPIPFLPCSPFPGEFTCWAHWKILNLDPKTLPGLILLQRWEQLGRGRGDGCRLHRACRGLVARAAAGVTAGNGTEGRTGECMEQSHPGNGCFTKKGKYQNFGSSTGLPPFCAWFCFCAAAQLFAGI